MPSRLLPFLGAVSDEQRRVAVARVRENIRRIVAREDDAVADMLRALEDARRRLLARMATGTEFDVAMGNALLRENEELIRELRRRLPPILQSSFRDALRQGDGDVVGYAIDSLPIAEAGPGFASIDPVLLDFAARNSATLVDQITTKLRADLDMAITAAATGSSTPADVAARIGTVLREADRDPGVFGTIATQVERVTRTEIGRLYSGAAEIRIKRLEKDTSRVVRKRWVATNDDRTRPTHRHLNGAEIPSDEHFNVGVAADSDESSWWRRSYEEAQREGGPLATRATGPHDSVLPASESVNCRCVLVPAFGAVIAGPVAAAIATRAARADRRGLLLVPASEWRRLRAAWSRTRRRAV